MFDITLQKCDILPTNFVDIYTKNNMPQKRDHFLPISGILKNFR